tara:strand:+ start:5453 stop:6334 length:882 start_codon:yes stop_codon:yes gene_type:complete
MSSSMSWFVIVGTLGSILFFFILLLSNKNGDNPGEKLDHSVDGIEEYDNPLPAWWLWMFIGSMVFGLCYLAYYPGLGNFSGLGDWSQIKLLEKKQAIALDKFGPIYEKYGSQDIKYLLDNQEVIKMGKRIFVVHCSACHGADAKGSIGFPNLVDSEWIWGDSTEAIQHSITNGRNAAMPAWLTIIGERGVSEVAEYVLSISKSSYNEDLVGNGKEYFQNYCFGCHGMDGTGNLALGTPNLTNDLWLYGHSKERIMDVIANGRNGVMPAFKDKLSSDKIHIVNAYIQSLSNENP